jgi:hypothetical protein
LAWILHARERVVVEDGNYTRIVELLQASSLLTYV